MCAEVSDHDRWQHLSPKWGRKARALLHLTLTTSERDMSERDDDCAVSAGLSFTTSEKDDDCAVSAGQYSSSTTLTHETDISSVLPQRPNWTAPSSGMEHFQSLIKKSDSSGS